jgi:acyl carrier protein
MTREELLTHVDQAIKTVLNNPGLAIADESKLSADLNIESIDLLDISSELEKSVGRELDFKELAKQALEAEGRGPRDLRVADVVNYLQRLTN